MKRILLHVLPLFLLCTGNLSGLMAQEVPEHISRKDIYEFIDELANLHAISVNTVAKPFSRLQIAELLIEAAASDVDLNKRQKAELDFYLGIYTPDINGGDTTQYYFHELFRKDLTFSFPRGRYDLFHKRDGIFRLTLNPILGYENISSGGNSMFHRWNGLEAYAYAGEHFGFYANLRDNTESIRLTDPDYMVNQTGANYKPRGDGGDYSEMRGGITYSWDWGSIALEKDHFTWGNNYHGANIFSGHQPSFALLDLKMHPADWFEFRYVHGWLVSEVIDSARSWSYINSYGSGQRQVFIGKYLAANMLSVRPFKHTWLSIGNSIIYSDIGFHPAYLMPLGFFKSIDHTYNGTGSNYLGHNSQMFFDLSVREIPRTHLFMTVYVDEISFSNMWDKDKHSNFYSAKAGLRLSGLPVMNTGATIEYTRTNPLAFRHNMPVTTFESNNYILGHYLKDNAEELYMAFYWKPVRNLRCEAFYNKARKGPDYNAIGGDIKGLPFISDEVWSLRTLGIDISYQLFNNVNLSVGYANHKIGGSDPDASAVYLPSTIYDKGNQFKFSVGISR